MSRRVVAEPRNNIVVDVNLLLIQNGRVLLGQRQNTGFEDGKFHLPAGHVEAGETVVSALVREAHEELGITIRPEQMTFAFVLHDRAGDGRVRFFFRAYEWIGLVKNREPEKCAALGWFDLNDLPKNLVPYARYVIQHHEEGGSFALYGWENPD